MRYLAKEPIYTKDVIDEQFDRMFNRIFSTDYNFDFKKPIVDALEEEEKYTLQIELPGFKKNDIKISIDDKKLIIETEVKSTQQKAKYLLQERTRKNFKRTFSLPSDIDKEKITAEIKDGILTVELIKNTEKKPIKIEIKS